MHKLLFFASGSGTNFQSVIDAVESGRVNASICGLITDRLGAGAIQRARKHSIPVHTIFSKDNDQFTTELLSALEDLSPDLIILAGYLRKIPDRIINLYRGRIINIHPSLLPKYGGKGFYGQNVHHAVIENGESWSGCTVHFVDEIYDNGAIIAQKKVRVKADDTPETLAKKILKEEHKLLPDTIKHLLTQK
ncbi:phosphoribosylglycinamide formyltransferase [soil metagenome]